MSLPAPKVYQLGFFAPVPRDHWALVATVQREQMRGSFVLDQTAGVLYADSTLWGPLGARPSAVTDPLATLASFGWQPTELTTGRVAGAMISSKNTGQVNYAETRLFVEPAPSGAPYR